MFRSRGNSSMRHMTFRRAFTLVEILVVVAIIGILLTVIAIASVRMLAGAREQQTRTTIKKIDDILSSRTAAFQRAMTGRLLPGQTVAGESELLTKYQMPLRPTHEGMRFKRLYGRFFGMSFGETFSNGGGVAIPNFAADLTAAELTEAGFSPSPVHKPETENPEMLYWFIMKGPTFGSDVQTDFNSSETADTDGDGLLEFVDAWGRPLRFYRWPTRLLRPAPASALASQGTPYHPLGPASGGTLSSEAPATFLIGSLPSYNTTGDTLDPTQVPTTPLGHDTDDAMGEAFFGFMAEGGFSTPAAAALAFETLYHTPNTWHAPLIVSAGPDGELGLFEPTERASFGHLAQPNITSPTNPTTGYSRYLEDNVTNLNGQASGTGGQ